MKRLHAALLALGAGAVPALAQTDIEPANKYSWGENIGFMNWADAGDPLGMQGVRVNPTFLSGFIWGENVGWINVGDGTPVDGVSYSNADGADFGVNRALDDTLGGYAWGENIGWINFSGGAMATPANAARFDAAARRFRGYAWGENVGWINLDDPLIYVGTFCPADYNRDGFVDGIDYDSFNNDFESTDPGQQMNADFNRDGFVDGIDYDAFNNAFEAGC